MKTREGKTHNDPTTESWKYQSLNLMRFAPRDTNTVSGVYGLVEDSTKDSYVLVRETFDPTLQPLLRQESLRMYLDKRNAKQVILVPFWGIWMYSTAVSPSKQALHQTWGSVSGSVHGQITSLQLVPLSVHVKLEQWCKDSNNLTFQLPTDLSLRTFSGATIEPLPPGQGAFALHTKANTWQLLIRVDPVLCSQFLNQQNYVQLKERLLYKPEVAEPQPHAQRAIYDQVVRNYDTKKHRVTHASEPRVLREMNRTEDVVQQTTESVEVYEFKNPPGTYRMEETEIKTNMVVPYVTGLTRSAPSRKFIVVDTHSKTHKHSDSDTSCVNNIDGCENTKDGTASKTASGSRLYEKLLKLVQSMDQSVGNT